MLQEFYRITDLYMMKKITQIVDITCLGAWIFMGIPEQVQRNVKIASVLSYR